MELDQVLNILRLICCNESVRHGRKNCSQEEAIINHFGHWCLTNQLNYTLIRKDLRTPNPLQSIVFQWFRRTHAINIYNHLVKVVIQTEEQPVQQTISSACDRALVRPSIKATKHEQGDFASYHNSGDDSDEAVTSVSPQDDEYAVDGAFTQLNLNYSTDNLWLLADHDQLDSGHFYDDVDVEEMAATGDSYDFSAWIADSAFKVEYSVFELIAAIQCLPLSTMNAVWLRMGKNEDGLVGDKQNVCLCLHVLLCICIKEKYRHQQQQKTNYSFHTEQSYLSFLDTLGSQLCETFLLRTVRSKDKALSLVDNKSSSIIVLGFGDLVEELPKWLLQCNDYILSRNNSR